MLRPTASRDPQVARTKTTPRHRRPTRVRAPLALFEHLEDRKLLAPVAATLYVEAAALYTDPAHPGAPQAGDTVTWNPGPNNAFTAAGPVANLTFGTNAFTTIQAAVNAAGPGATIKVAAGTYSEAVSVTKSVTLLGAEMNVDARTRAGVAETILDQTGANGKTAFAVAANNVTINGFTIENQTNTNVFGAAIWLEPGTSGSTIKDDVVQNNVVGLFVANNSAVSPTVVQDNLFKDNNQPGPASGQGVYADQYTAGAGMQNVLIQNNTFTNTSFVENSWGVGISNTAATSFTNLSVVNNSFSNAGRGMYFFGTTNSAVTGNVISGATHYAIGLFGNNGTPANASFTISGNTLTNNGAGIELVDDTPGSAYAGTLTPSGDFYTTTGAQSSIYNDSTTPIDATGETFNTVPAATASTAQQFTIVDTIVDGVDVPGLGLVRTKAGNVYVTPNSFNAGLGTTAPSIQRGINVATAGDTVNVAAGTYTENDSITKNLSLIGQGPGSTQINAGSGTGIAIGSPASVVTLQGLRVTTSAAALSVTGGLTTFNLTNFQSDGGGTSAISSVATLNVDQSANPGAEVVTASGSGLGETGALPIQTTTLAGVQNLNVTTGSGQDTFHVTPPPAGGTKITVNGGLPTTVPGDTLDLDLSATINAMIHSTGPGAGNVTSDHATVYWTGIETVNQTLPQADLAVFKSGPSSATAGTTITYFVTVTNNGPGTAQNVTLTDTLPAGTTFVNQTQDGGPPFTLSNTGNAISDTIALLAPGASQTFTITAMLLASDASNSTVSNTATVGSTTADPNPGNNSSTANTTVQTSADLVLTVNSAPPIVPRGGILTYTVTVTNNGPSDAAHVLFNDSLPSATTFVSQTQTAGGPQFTLTHNGNSIGDSILDLPAGASQTFTIMTRVKPTATIGSTLSNSAAVFSFTPDPNFGNNSRQTTNTVGAAPAPVAGPAQSVPAATPSGPAVSKSNVVVARTVQARPPSRPAQALPAWWRHG